MKKIGSLLLVCLSIVFLFSGCNSNNADVTTLQSSKKSNDMVTVGIAQIAPHGSLDNCRKGFVAGLEESGYVEGDNIVFDYKNAEGDTSNAAMITDTFVGKQYDLICGIATPTAMAAYNSVQGTNIPVVFTAVSDPLTAELVTSLDIPENNCTGTCDILPIESQLQMIRAFLPSAKTIGVLYTLSEVNSLTHLKTLKELAPSYGFEIEAIGVTSSSEISLACDTLLSKVDCINNFTDNNVVNNLNTILQKANEVGVPVFGSEEEQVKKGCVAAQNIDYYALGKETGRMAANILNGEDAKTMPVSVISECKPVANQSVLDFFELTVPEEYQSTITYLAPDKES